MRLGVRMQARLAADDGFTMIAVVGAIALISMLAAATLAATNGDLNLTQRDLDYKRAHAAAEAGLADYSFHLNNDNSYWTRCTEVPSPESNPSAVNQVGEQVHRRDVPESEAEYAIELLPAEGHSECVPHESASMIEQGGSGIGTFRIRSTGFSGKSKVSIVATYKRASLLDYVYFTRFETSDPITYGEVSWLPAAYEQCTKFRREGREDQPIPGSGGRYCDMIVFVEEDDIQGPVHTNDDFALCGAPTLGRDAGDVIEVGSPEEEAWIDGHCSHYPPASEDNFKGPLVATAPVLTPPATNQSLEAIAGEEYTFSCQTEIDLEGDQMTVTTNKGGKETKPFPSSGVIYVKQGSCEDLESTTGGKHPKTIHYYWPSCLTEYSPFTATYVSYPEGRDCGSVYVHGHYAGELTIAAERDIVVDGNLTNDGDGLLGLIANKFVRIKHPVCVDREKHDNTPEEGCPSGEKPAETEKGHCNGGHNENSLSSPKIEAAILAIEHSFIVDHYDCGSSLGTLNVKGAISQKYRGAVGTTGGTGYYKNYEYDDRLRYQEPPNFLDPIEPAWHIQRETLDFPE